MRVKNVSGEVIPTYSAAEIMENKGDYWEIDKPSSASIDPSIVCFVPTPVPIGGFAEAVYPEHEGLSCVRTAEIEIETIKLGDTVSTIEDSGIGLIRKAQKTGFIFMGYTITQGAEPVKYALIS